MPNSIARLTIPTSRDSQQIYSKLLGLRGEHVIAVEEFFPPEFMQSSTAFASIGSMLEASPVSMTGPREPVDLDAHGRQLWEDFVRRATRFSSWESMKRHAGLAWINAQLSGRQRSGSGTPQLRQKGDSVAPLPGGADSTIASQPRKLPLEFLEPSSDSKIAEPADLQWMDDDILESSIQFVSNRGLPPYRTMFEGQMNQAARQLLDQITYEIHHLKLVEFRDFYGKRIVDNKANLRAVQKQIHGQVSSYITTYLSSVARREGISGVTWRTDLHKAFLEGKIPKQKALHYLKVLEDAINRKFGMYFIKVTASTKDVQQVLDRLAVIGIVKKAADQRFVKYLTETRESKLRWLDKVGLGLGIFTMIHLRAKQALAIAHPNEEQLRALDAFLLAYERALHERARKGAIPAGTLAYLGETMERWLKSAEVDSEIRNLIQADFNELVVQAPGT